MPPSSLIICSRNRRRLLAETIESVLAGDEVPAEIVVIDQSDAAHTSLQAMTSVRECEVRYRWAESRGKGWASNQAIAAARFDVLVFTDDDVQVDPRWLGLMVRTLVRRGNRTVVTGQVRPTGERTDGFVPAIKAQRTPAIYEGRDGTGGYVLPGLSMAMYRTALEAVGHFDDRLGPGSRYAAADDLDLAFRLLEAGYRVEYVPEAVVYHRAWRSNRALLRLRWDYGVGRGAFYAKHLSLTDRYILRRFVGDIAAHSRGVPNKLRNDRYAACGDAALALGILLGATKWLLSERARL